MSRVQQLLDNESATLYPEVMGFGTVLQELRHRTGRSQAELAGPAGLSVWHWSRLEQDDGPRPRLDTVVRILVAVRRLVSLSDEETGCLLDAAGYGAVSLEVVNSMIQQYERGQGKQAADGTHTAVPRPTGLVLKSRERLSPGDSAPAEVSDTMELLRKYFEVLQEPNLPESDREFAVVSLRTLVDWLSSKTRDSQHRNVQGQHE